MSGPALWAVIMGLRFSIALRRTLLAPWRADADPAHAGILKTQSARGAAWQGPHTSTYIEWLSVLIVILCHSHQDCSKQKCVDRHRVHRGTLCITVGGGGRGEMTRTVVPPRQYNLACCNVRRVTPFLHPTMARVSVFDFFYLCHREIRDAGARNNKGKFKKKINSACSLLPLLISIVSVSRAAYSTAKKQ